jgi:hypothetical protein
MDANIVGKPITVNMVGGWNPKKSNDYHSWHREAQSIFIETYSIPFVERGTEKKNNGEKPPPFRKARVECCIIKRTERGSRPHDISTESAKKHDLKYCLSV